MFVRSPIFTQFTNSMTTQNKERTASADNAPQQIQNNAPLDIAVNKLEALIALSGSDAILPDENNNFSQFNQARIEEILKYKETAIPYLTKFLEQTDDEKQVTEGLYILDRMIDTGVKDIFKTYPVISKFNYTKSPNIQVMLAGVYRKTQVPDAFGPLMTMFLKNSQNPVTKPFDPNEEIGGAILEYLRNKTSVSNYAKTQGH